jgi:hypothetical protein
MLFRAFYTLWVIDYRVTGRGNLGKTGVSDMWFVGEYEYREQEAALSLAGMDRLLAK